MRDQFSAGGQEEMLLSSGECVKFPGVFRRVKDNCDLFFRRISQLDPKALIDRSVADVEIVNKRLIRWAEEVSQYTTMDYGVSLDALKTFFWRAKDMSSPWWRNRI